MYIDNVVFYSDYIFQKENKEKQKQFLFFLNYYR